MTKTDSPWNSVLKYISFRPRTEAEVRKYLGENCTEAYISRLKELNFINDVEYAKSYIESRLSRSPRSAAILKIELQRRGITTFPEIDEQQVASQALAKKFKSWPNLSWPQFHLKAYRFLQSRGFRSDVIEKVVKISYNKSHVK